MKKTYLYVIASLALFAVAFGVRAHQKPERAQLPNLDRRNTPAQATAVAGAAALPSHAAAVARLHAHLPGVKVEHDELIGSPRFISAPTGFLTGPKGEGGAVSAAATRAFAADDPHRAAKAFVNDHTGLFGHNATALANAPVKRDYTTAHNGLRSTVWEQHLDGVRVFEALFAAHVTKKGELVSVASHFVPEPAQAADNTHGDRAVIATNPAITARQALALAAKNVGDEQDPAAVTAVDTAPEGADKRQRFTAAAVKSEAEARLVWLPMNRTTLRLCWELIFTSRSRGEMFRVLIDATTGEALLRHNLTSYISDASYRVYTSDSPTPFSPGHSTPSSVQPPAVPRVLVVTNAFNTNASPNGWIDDGVNETRGNNVDAHTDHNGDDQPDLPRPQGSPNRVFDFPMNLSQPPTTYSSAAVVQLFYLCNVIHDRFYELGFTEAAGNFQINNFGRGGAGNDPVQADAQDGDGFNNANFSTPPDGFSGRMQMFVFNGPTPDIDGDFDAEIVIHEYTHGLSNRRVGNGVGISQLATAGMGEGWSDFYGLCLLSEPGDDLDANYAAGGYATREFFGLRENYYFGIRRYPYTTDMSKNPLTFRDIDPSQFNSHPEVPVSPVGGFGNPAAVHNQGEVWCVTLWEARANLIRKHGFAAGNQLILRLVTDGMGLGPANPNFIQARNAILLADRVLTGGENEDELWRAFAKRGMGAYATAPPSSTTTGLRESFDLPDDLLITPLIDLSATGPVGGPFSVSSWIFTLTNTGSSNINFTTRSRGLLDANPATGLLLPGGPSITVTARLSSAVANLPGGSYADTLTFSNTVSGVSQFRALALRIGQQGYFTEQFDFDSNDLNNITVTLTPDGSENFYDVCRVAATTFPTSPTGGNRLALTDDSFAAVDLDGAEVSIFAKTATELFVGSNGYITFVNGDTSFSEALANHFRLPRVSALFTDLNPANGGTISWIQLNDRIAVTWENVPEFGADNVNSFQIELFLDGRIRITHLRIDVGEGIVGVSAGDGTPADFIESDWSAFSSCSARLTLSVPSPVAENAGLLPDAGLVSLDQPALAQVTVFLVSANTNVATMPTTVIIPAGETNASFPITLTDNALINGTTRVRLTANAVGRRPATALLTVTDDEVASLGVSLPARAREGDGLLADAGIVTVNPAPDRALIVRLLSANTNELAVPNGIVIVPAGQTSAVFSVQIVDDRRVDGDQSGNIIASVESWPQGSGTMTVGDNESTNLFLSLPALVNESAGTVINGGTVFLEGTAISNVTVSLESLDTSEITLPPAVTIFAGQNFRRFNLTVVDDTSLDDTQAVFITASAPGFGAGTGTVSVADNEFPVEPFFPNPPNFATSVALDANLSWSSGDGEQIINGDFERGDLTGWIAENTGIGSFVINNGTFDPRSPDGPTPAFAGNFSALSRQQNAGLRSIYQDVVIPAGATFATLSWTDRIRNHGTAFGPEQSFKVTARDLISGATSLLFDTTNNLPLLNDWTNRVVDITSLRGRTLRLAFLVQDELGFLNVHLDNISLFVGSPLPTTFDVYFGTNPVPGATEFVGTATNTSWELPPLTQWTTYYWQVIARRGPAGVPSPVWRFLTRGSSGTNLLVRAGSVWKYLDDGSDQSTAWREPGFDESEWAEGPARLGYGGDGERTTVRFGADPNNKPITTYFRHSFTISNAADFVSLTGRIARDDGAVVYLNGVEVIRDNLLSGVLNYRTLANTTVNSPNETAFFSYPIAPQLLVNGVNVVAIEIHQVQPDSSDMGMDFDLSGTLAIRTNQLPSVTVTNPISYAQFTTPVTVVLSASASDADGTIRRVDFYAGTTKIGEDTTAPYTYSWINPPAATYAITAIAMDNTGATNASTPVSFVVNRSGNMPVTLAPFGARWRYLDNGSDQGTAWSGTNFNDSAWAQGRAQLGYGDGDESTTVGYGPDPNNRYITTYFRHTFTNIANFTSLSVSLIRDDGAVVYLNGVEVFRNNMPAGTITRLTPATSALNEPEEHQPVVANINPARLVRGRNVLAVEVHQRDVFSSDLSFDIELSGLGNFPPAVALTAPANDSVFTAPPTVTLAATASDRYGTVARVAFFDGTTLIGTDTNAPFALPWQPTPGIRQITALATDNLGGTNRSAPVQVNILPPPAITATINSDALTLAWPATAFEFSLESAFNLAPPLLWSPVTNPVVNDGSQFKTILGSGQTNQYFRLFRP